MAQTTTTSLKRKHPEAADNNPEAPASKKRKTDSLDTNDNKLAKELNVTHGDTSYALTMRQQRKQKRTGFTQQERNTYRKEQKRKRNREKFESMTEEEKEEHIQQKMEQRKLKQERKEMHNKKLLAASKNGMKICIDFYFNRYFNKDMQYTNMIKQLCYCWNANKLAKQSVSLHLLNVDQNWNEYFVKQGIVGWKGIHIHQKKDILECFPDESKQHFVYLSPDSDVILDENEFVKNKDTNIYIIGGIIDRVIQKNLTLNRAKELGIRHYKLPLNRVQNLQGRNCLNVNAVFKMLLRFQNNDEAWKDIMEQEIPKRNKQSTRTRKERRKTVKAINDTHKNDEQNDESETKK